MEGNGLIVFWFLSQNAVLHYRVCVLKKCMHRHQSRSSKKQMTRQDSAHTRFVGRTPGKDDHEDPGKAGRVPRQPCNPDRPWRGGKGRREAVCLRLLCHQRKFGPRSGEPLNWRHRLEEAHVWRKGPADSLVDGGGGAARGKRGFSKNTMVDPRGSLELSLHSPGAGLCCVVRAVTACIYVIKFVLFLLVSCFFFTSWIHFHHDYALPQFFWALSSFSQFNYIYDSYSILCASDFLFSPGFVLWPGLSTEMVCHLLTMTIF